MLNVISFINISNCNILISHLCVYNSKGIFSLLYPKKYIIPINNYFHKHYNDEENIDNILYNFL